MKMKILIADDDRVSLMMMRRMLVQSGYDVSTVCDGRAAVESLAQEDGPRLLLLDWMMPSLNGPEVCRAIRAQAHRGYVYIILLTAKDTKEDLIEALEAGADDFLTKPCHPEELTARLRTGQRILQLEDGLVAARDEMQFRATHDSLTGVLNRGAIVHALSNHLREQDRDQQTSAVLLCDVDHFKQINDTYGHPVGDEVLRAIARRLDSLRLSKDEVGRFGGEEFLLLLRDVSTDRLAALGTNLCDAIRSSPVNTSVGDISVSMSVGVLGIGRVGQQADVDDVLHRADQLLYRAKKEGRNRAVVERPHSAAIVEAERFGSVFFPPALLLG